VLASRWRRPFTRLGPGSKPRYRRPAPCPARSRAVVFTDRVLAIDRVQFVFRGEAIELHTQGRSDLLKAKVFALCDRGFDLPDCVALGR